MAYGPGSEVSAGEPDVDGGVVVDVLDEEFVSIPPAGRGNGLPLAWNEVSPPGLVSA